MNRFSSALLIGSLFLAGAAHAQDWRNRQERGRTARRSVRTSARSVTTGVISPRCRPMLTRFDAAWSQRNEREMASAEARLRELLHTELAESRAELERDKAEVRRDNREVRGGRRELGRDELWGKPGAFADDRRDLRDDRRNQAR